MSAAALSSLCLQSSWSMPIVEGLRKFDPRLPASPLNPDDAHGFAWLMILTTGFTTLSWLLVTFATPPEPAAKLQEFYDRVQPASLGWRMFSKHRPSRQSLRWAAVDWVLGCMMIYCALFGIGHLVFGEVGTGLVLLLTAAACIALIFYDLNRRGWESLSG